MNQASDYGFQQFVASFQTYEFVGRHHLYPFILADANARAINIDFAAADALPAFEDLSHCIYPSLRIKTTEPASRRCIC
jgi:hypothetical protein